jgi:hypothetical protein
MVYGLIHQNLAIMKTSTKTTVLLKSIDLELKALLQNDLKAFKAKAAGSNQGTSKQLQAA